MFSRNASSSRAIPIQRMIDAALSNPAMPEFWGKNQAGMQATEELDDTTKNQYQWIFGRGMVAVTAKEAAKMDWLKARDHAVDSVTKLMALGVHKQLANRPLEPWLHITVVASATEHGNFFSLRAHKDAQPEFQKLAYLMLDIYQQSHPTRLKEGEWHIPFGDQIDDARLNPLLDELNKAQWVSPLREASIKLKIAVARCARVSYLNFEGKNDYKADIELADRLATSGHWSPFEHCALALPNHEWSGNFRGWKQYRKFYPQENRGDGRIPQFTDVHS
jgi:thymidylate synthase ThyX